MPHVAAEGTGDLQVLYQAFRPLIQRAGNDILKVQEFYLAQSGKEALLESISIEEGAVCNYFVQLKLHEKAITVRLLPAIDPEKTPAVKESDGHASRIHSESVQGQSLRQDQLTGISGGGDGLNVSENRREDQQEER